MFRFYTFIAVSALFFSADVKAVDCLDRLETLQQYQDQEGSCFDNSDFNYQLGLLALEKGDLSQAVSAFERVVALDSRHAGAWLDMTEAYFRLGDRKGVHYAIGELEKRFTIPEGLVAVVAKYKEWSQWYQPKYANRGGAFISKGYSDNINAGSSRHSIDLVFGQQIIRVDLDDESQSIADAYSDIGGYWQFDYQNYSATSKTKSDSYYLRLSANKRFYDMEDRYNSGVIMMNGGRVYNSKRERLSLNLGTILYSQRGRIYQQGLLLGAQYDKRLTQDSTFQVQIACDHNRYRDSEVGDVNKCSNQFKVKRDHHFGEFSATFLSGMDWKSDTHAGGDTFWYGARLEWLYSFSNATLSAYTRYEQESDDKPYSEEILGNKKRNKTTNASGLSYEYFITKQASIELSASASRTRSDIALFETEQNKAAVSLYYYW